MIVFVVTRKHDSTIRSFRDHWAQQFGERIGILHYEMLPVVRRLPLATYLFSDLERLTPAATGLAESLWNQLDSWGAGLRLLNHPALSLRRADLLSALYQSGCNRFRASGLSVGADLQTPVFLRRANDHKGSLTRLIHERTHLDRAVKRLTSRGIPRNELLAVEFCNTSDSDGVFRKYSVFVVGDVIVPRHLMHGRNWMLKEPEFVNAQTIREETEFLAANPHADALRTVFRTARIDYGRADYALLDGRPQIWEINTNPVILKAPKHYSKGRIPMQLRFSEAICRVLGEIDRPGPADEFIPIELRG